MLAIVNVSPDDTPLTGRNKYEVRINRRVIATFEHDRKPDGAAQCLRDAADAVDRCREEDRAALLEALLSMSPNAALTGGEAVPVESTVIRLATGEQDMSAR